MLSQATAPLLHRNEHAVSAHIYRTGTARVFSRGICSPHPHQDGTLRPVCYYRLYRSHHGIAFVKPPL